MNDAALLSGWRDGDGRAGDTLVRRHYEPLVWFFRSRTGADPDRAADLAQATFAVVAEKRDAIAASFRGYLYGVARMKLHEYYRSESRRQGWFEPLLVSAADPEGADPERREAEQIWVQAYRSLSVDDRLLIELKDYEGWTNPELAEVLDLQLTQVKGRLHRARARLEAAIADVVEDPAGREHTQRSLDSALRSMRELGASLAADRNTAAGGADD